MISSRHNVLYMPYGAYELKATYQRHMLIGMLLITLLTVVSVAIWQYMIFTAPILPVIPGGEKGADTTIIIKARIRQQVSIKYEEPPFGKTPPLTTGEAGIPVPVPDNEIGELDV